VRIPEEYHHRFTDEYLGDRHVFRVWAHNPEVLEATLEYLSVLYDQLGQRRTGRSFIRFLYIFTFFVFFESVLRYFVRISVRLFLVFHSERG